MGDRYRDAEYEGALQNMIDDRGRELSAQDKTIERLEAEVERLKSVNEDYLEALDDAKYDEPELRATIERLRGALREIRGRQVSAWQIRVIDEALGEEG